MLRCDFSSVIGIIREYISEGNSTSQPDFISDLFCTFLEKNEEFDFDNGQINRWIKGLAAVSPKIAEFYQRKSAAKSLAYDIESGILPILYDKNMAAQTLYSLVLYDTSISEQKRNELTAEYPEDIAAFIATVIIFAISRKFEKRDIKSLAFGTLSPVVSDMIFDGEVPKSCKHFCGRDTELESLHELLNKHNKVFIHGIAGIGKSEFAKAYAYAHKKDYTNILYFQYNGSLQKMIADMDFADDNSGDDETERFRKHNRFLRSLKDDTLLIVDNFNTTASKETKLDILMKYNCRVIFTTRSSFEIGTAFELTEISDIDTLVSFAGKFYSDLDSNKETVVKIIEAVHRHTLAVEMSARLLQKGMLEPDELLSALLNSSANPQMDKISLLPMVRDIAATDLSPTVTNCITLLNYVHQICLRHGEDVPYRKTLFEIVESIIRYAEKDNFSFYIRFIEDAFSYMEKYKYENGMRLIVSEMDMYKVELAQNDLALFYDCQSSVEAILNKNYNKAISLSKKAIKVCVPEENLHLAANLHMNLGYCYHLNGNTDLAKQSMETAIAYMWEHNELNNDVIIMIHNYANLMSDLGEPIKAVRAMKKCAALVKSENTDKCTDYADLIFDIAAISLQIGNTDTAKTYFIKAFNIYREILPQADLTEKTELAAEYLKRVGLSDAPDFLALTQNTE